MKSSNTGEWVVLIEDNSDHALLICDALEAAPEALQVHLLTDGRAALDWIAAPPDGVPAAVVLDLQLPDATGVEVLRAIRAHPVLADVPVFVLTTSHSPEEVRRCRRYGASAYLTKDTGLGILARRGLDVAGLWPDFTSRN